MMMRRAAGEAVKRALRVWIAAAIVILIGLLVFQKHERLPDWVWRLEAQRAVERLL